MIAQGSQGLNGKRRPRYEIEQTLITLTGSGPTSSFENYPNSDTNLEPKMIKVNSIENSNGLIASSDDAILF